MQPSVAIVGAGAIGAWIADALWHADWDVALLARGATLAALSTRGLEVRGVGAGGGESRHSTPRTLAAGALTPHDYVILTVKAHALPRLAPSLAPLIGPDSVVVSAANGIPWWFFHDFGGVLANHPLHSVDPLRTQELTFPRQRTLGAVVHASVRVNAPGEVQVVAADRLILGEPNGEATTRVERLAAALRIGGIDVRVSPRIRHEVWVKLWGNMNMNPVSALTRRGTAAILADADVRELCTRMMREMQCCAERLALDAGMTPEERIAVTQRLGDFKTSMLVDLEAGRPLELDPQLGAVAEIAERLQVAAPFMRAVLGLTRLLAG